MAISNNGVNYNNTSNNGGYINLAALNGSGESTMFVDDVEGVLVGIQTREGFYTVNDRKTGQPIQRPNRHSAAHSRCGCTCGKMIATSTTLRW